MAVGGRTIHTVCGSSGGLPNRATYFAPTGAIRMDGSVYMVRPVSHLSRDIGHGMMGMMSIPARCGESMQGVKKGGVFRRRRLIVPLMM